MSPAPRLRWSVGIAATVATAACVIPAAEIVETGTGSGGSSGCKSVRWPGPPAQDDPGSETYDFVVAVHAVDLGETDPELDTVGPRIGYDLDQMCTGNGAPSSCLAPDGVDASELKDGPGGIDNRAARLIAAATDFSDTLASDNFTTNADEGDWSLLIRVRDYNGMQNDTNVTVALYPSPGIFVESCIELTDRPLWDGTDRWPVDAASLEPGDGPGSDGGLGPCGAGVPGYSFDKPRFVDTNAYVSGGVLVANLPSTEVILNSGGDPVSLRLTGGFVTGTIVPDAEGTFRIAKGTVTGRWKTGDMFEALAHAVGGVPVCTDNAIYKAVKTGICQARDIASALGGPTTPCDAVSIAVAIETEPAKLGAVVHGNLSPAMCTPETDPAFDSCDVVAPKP